MLSSFALTCTYSLEAGGPPARAVGGGGGGAAAGGGGERDSTHGGSHRGLHVREKELLGDGWSKERRNGLVRAWQTSSGGSRGGGGAWHSTAVGGAGRKEHA